MRILILTSKNHFYANSLLRLLLEDADLRRDDKDELVAGPPWEARCPV